MSLFDGLRVRAARRRLRSKSIDEFDRGLRTILDLSARNSVARTELIKLYVEPGHFGTEEAWKEKNRDLIRARLLNLPEAEVIPELAACLAVRAPNGRLYYKGLSASLLAKIGSKAAVADLVTFFERVTSERAETVEHLRLFDLAEGLATTNSPEAINAILKLWRTDVGTTLLEEFKRFRDAKPWCEGHFPIWRKVAQRRLDEVRSLLNDNKVLKSLPLTGSNQHRPHALLLEAITLARIVVTPETTELAPEIVRWGCEPGLDTQYWIDCMEMLVCLRTPEATNLLLLKAQEPNQSEFCCVCAIELMGELGDDRAVEFLEQIARNESSKRSAFAVNALARIGGPRVAPLADLLLSKLENPEVLRREYDSWPISLMTRVEYFCRLKDDRGLRAILVECKRGDHSHPPISTLRELFRRYPESAGPDLLNELAALREIRCEYDVTCWDDDHGMSYLEHRSEVHRVDDIAQLARDELARRSGLAPSGSF